MDLGALNTWLGELEDWLWSGFGIGIVSLVAIYFTIRTKAVQIHMIPAMFRSITDKSQRDESAADNRKSLSAFQAFTISAAARVGTGNISGVAGAIFIFCFALAFTSLQANAIVAAVDGAVAAYADPASMPWIPVVVGLLLAAATALVVIGGMRRVARVARRGSAVGICLLGDRACRGADQYWNCRGSSIRWSPEPSTRRPSAVARSVPRSLPACSAACSPMRRAWARSPTWPPRPGQPSGEAGPGADPGWCLLRHPARLLDHGLHGAGRLPGRLGRRRGPGDGPGVG